MAFTSGLKNVTNAATVIAAIPQGGWLLAQNLGTAAVTLGGPSVVAGSGPSLPAAMTSPIAIPAGIVPGETDADDHLYGRTAGGSANIAWMVAA